MISLTTDRISYRSSNLVPNPPRVSARVKTRSLQRVGVELRGIPMGRFPELPDRFPSMPKKPYLPPKLYRRPDVDIQEESQAAYKDVTQGLTEAGATPRQIEMWRDTFVSLEEKGFLTNEFSRGFIELVKAKATDIELDSYVGTAELLITASNGKASLDSLIVRYLDVVQRKDLNERARKRLLLNEQVNVIKDSVKEGKLNVKDVLRLILKVGINLAIKLASVFLGKVF